MARQAGDIVDVQLVHDLLTMLFDGFYADAEFAGDLLIGKTFGDQLEDFSFAGGQFGGFPGGLPAGDRSERAVCAAGGGDLSRGRAGDAGQRAGSLRARRRPCAV